VPLFSNFIIIDISQAANQHNRMISDGSCDTEDWSNDAENSAFEWWCKACFHLKSRKKVIVKVLNKILVFMNYKAAVVDYKYANN